MVNDMDYKSTIKKHSIIISICVICSVLLIAGTSYALFFQMNINTENQVVKTGKLAVTYGDQSSKIAVTSLSPMEDEDALQNDSYSSRVNIENTGSLPASYVLKIGKDIASLENDGGNINDFVNLAYVRVAAYVNNEEILAPSTLGDMTSGEDGMYTLYTGTIAVEGTIDVVVKVWLDKDTPETEAGKYIYFKLDVNSVVDEANTPEGQTVEEGN